MPTLLNTVDLTTKALKAARSRLKDNAKDCCIMDAFVSCIPIRAAGHAHPLGVSQCLAAATKAAAQR